MTTEIIVGDCREVLRRLPAASVHCVVTSPPYFGLRDYGTGSWSGGDPSCDHVVRERRNGLGMVKLGERYRGGGHKAAQPKLIQAKDLCPRCGAVRSDGQIGLEETPSAYIAEMVEVFREVWRVLRDDGTLWVNMGDSYAGSRAGPQEGKGLLAGRTITDQRMMRRNDGNHKAREGKPKDLLGIPWRLAFALQDAGWYLRRDIIWSKPNPMPESVVDRPSSAHEYVFLMTKRPDYFYDGEAIVEPSSPGTHDRLSRKNLLNETGSFRANGGTDRPMKAGGRKLAANGSGIKNNGSMNAALRVMPETRNARSVWTIVTESFTGAHFATFPTKLAETCIKAGTSEWGCCPTCGAPWQRVVTKGEPNLAHRRASGADKSGGYNGQSTKDHDDAGVQNASDVKRRILNGMRHKTSTWVQGCTCAAAAPTPCMVLDPFAGACTTLMVADRLQRNSIGIELNRKYAAMGAARLAKDAGMFAEVSGVDGHSPPALDRQAAFDLLGGLAASESIPAAE